jgi:predicted negative regulator of RcsB-dependent stress response
MSELENYDQDRLFKNFFFKYRFHMVATIISIILLVILGRNLYLKNNLVNTSSLYDFNKIILDFASDSSSANLYSDLNEFLNNNKHSKYSFYISSMLSYIDFNKANFDMVVPLQKKNILKNDNKIFKDISKINLAAAYIEQDDFENALKSLDNVASDELKMLAFDIKGNILKDQGDIEGSIQSYTTALTFTNSNIPFENLLKSKIDLLSNPE